jgi:hypothetical protein
MHRKLVVLVLIVFLLVGCSPSAPAAPAPSPAPASTTTSVPPPFDLTVRVRDEGGAPVSWALITLAPLSLTQGANSDGEASWSDLKQASVTIAVSAQGYTPTQVSRELKPGKNNADVGLTRVPFGLLPTEACAPGEKLLYAEDFQDGEVSGWGAYPPGTPFAIQADPASADNRVLALDFGNADGEYEVRTLPLQDKVVRRFQYKPGDHSRFHMGWGVGQDGYFIVLSADQFLLNATHAGVVAQGLDKTKPVMQQGVWHLMEIVTDGESLEIWVDGQSRLSYQGSPIVQGDMLQLGSNKVPAKSLVYIDNISMCSLGGPFTSIYRAP